MTTDNALRGFMRRRAGLTLTGLVLLGMAGVAEAATPSQWVRSFWPTAKSAGVSWAVYDRALGDFSPDPDVLKKANSQAEFKSQIWDYLDITVTDERVTKGRELLETHATELAAIEKRYGVDREVVVAIWGIESHYGAVLDNPKIVKSTIRSLATLAYKGGRRSKFGRTQLVAALKILQRGDVAHHAMTGSWAGAMGHTQFIPTTYNAYAVDFDGDGRRDIWNSRTDALASAAAYLDKMGWRDDQTWGYEVEFTRSFNFGLLRNGGTRSLGEWEKRGVQRVGGKAFPRPGDSATLYAPAGGQGPAFLLIKNFSVIKRYNNSNFYALAVGHLSDRVRGGDPFHRTWPRTERPLTTAEKEQLQKLLAARGHYDGPIDGKIGSGSRGAIRDYQLQVGLVPDGMDSVKVLKHLEANQ
ncbi:lytic murein transglycosylase [Bauldia sp.]|uniref:lytic murein transglycosylase n=1 Tax=Bauldia sp. TaxID=2575872 RepID=UPI003BAA0359